MVNQTFSGVKIGKLLPVSPTGRIFGKRSLIEKKALRASHAAKRVSFFVSICFSYHAFEERNEVKRVSLLIDIFSLQKEKRSV